MLNAHGASWALPQLRTRQRCRRWLACEPSCSGGPASRAPAHREQACMAVCSIMLCLSPYRRGCSLRLAVPPINRMRSLSPWCSFGVACAGMFVLGRHAGRLIPLQLTLRCDSSDTAQNDHHAWHQLTYPLLNVCPSTDSRRPQARAWSCWRRRRLTAPTWSPQTRLRCTSSVW